jgi:hypothetical protein
MNLQSDLNDFSHIANRRHPAQDRIAQRKVRHAAEPRAVGTAWRVQPAKRNSNSKAEDPGCLTFAAIRLNRLGHFAGVQILPTVVLRVVGLC